MRFPEERMGTRKELKDGRSRAWIEPLSRDEMNEMSASTRREARVGTFKEGLTEE